MAIQLLAFHQVVAVILQPLNKLEFRLHTSIGRYPWAKLWYALRSLDQENTGYYELPLTLGELVTGADEKTIYRWLKTGKRDGAFRFYRAASRGSGRQIIRIGLGGLFKVCQKLNIRSWGDVTKYPLLEGLRFIRPLVTQIQTQVLQQKSRYAANSVIKKKNRPIYGSPLANELVPEKNLSSPKLGVGKLDFLFVLHRSKTRLFVSKGFCTFGTSQQSISWEAKLHKRTIQRHHRAIDLQSRQICQKKAAYGWLNTAFEHGSTEYSAEHHPNGGAGIGFRINGASTYLYDGHCHGTQKINAYSIPTEDMERRFFKLGKDWFMNKCNVYREELQLTTMRSARRKYKSILKKLSTTKCHSDSSQKIEPLHKGTIT